MALLMEPCPPPQCMYMGGPSGFPLVQAWKLPQVVCGLLLLSRALSTTWLLKLSYWALTGWVFGEVSDCGKPC